MSLARYALLPCIALTLGGCFNPDPAAEATETDTDVDPGSSSGASATTTDTPSTSGSSTTATSTTEPTDTVTTTVGESSTSLDPDSTGPVAAECGNGTLEGAEECDDGDLEAGDGCSSACIDETVACDPGLVGALAGSELERIAFRSGYLYGLRTLVPSRLVTIDASDPTDLAGANELSIDEDNYPNWNPGDLVASQTHLWTGGRNPELMSIDLASPDAPAFDFFAGPNDSDGPVEVMGDLLLQARSVSERINVWDISNPSNPSMLPPIGNPSQVFRDVAAADDMVIALAGSHVEIWDVSTPAVPAFVGELDGAPWTGSVRSAANGDTVAVATTGAGVGIIDYAIPSAPTVAATIGGENFPRDVAIRGEYVYVPVTNGLRVYDISNPRDPALAGSYLEVEVYGVSIALSDEHVFLGTEGGIRVLGDMPGFCDARCGNNTVEYPEACDDGNLDDGDGCSASCENE
ncbi:MAG: DUF4215 domain-containing protein [Nannocystaceae bacterium]|nr:hypothetical protein [bacterium]